MIKQLVKAIELNNLVSDYIITESTTKSHQAFFVLGKLETTRLVETTEYQVTIHVRHDGFIGYSTFKVSHKLSKSELDEKINEAVKAAGLVFNKDFNLVEGLKKKKFEDKKFEDSFDEILNKINSMMTRIVKPNVKFNAVELFYNEEIKHIVNSKGVNLTGKYYSLKIESIPSYDGEDDKVEIYKFNEYGTLDYKKIEEDMVQSLKDVTTRYEAKKLPKPQKIDVIIRDDEAEEFFYSFIDYYSYNSVYSGETDKEIGDSLQDEKAKSKLTISLAPSSKSHSFDDSGLLLEKNVIVEKGILKNYYGGNQYGQYLGLKPSGVPDELQVKKGSKTKEAITKGKYIEIISLSGIQIDVYSDYIGGEVRLGVLHDGEKTLPLNGFSFSGSFKAAVNNMLLSKETIKIVGYNGPKYIRIKNVKVI